jgi:2-oxoisovalerate dehydrogenase E1 component beta subunit
VVAPATPYDAKGLLKSAIRDDDPVLYFEHKRLYRSLKEDIPEGDFTVPIGVAEVRHEGRDLSIITYGGTVQQSLDAARIVEKADGVSIEVLDLRTLLPLDREAILATAKKTGKVLIVHEDRLTGGIGRSCGWRCGTRTTRLPRRWRKRFCPTPTRSSRRLSAWRVIEVRNGGRGRDAPNG